LLDAAEAGDLGQVYTDCGFILSRSPDTLRVPDVAFVRRERVAAQDEDQCYEGAPDLAIEILSPSDPPREMHAQVADYLAAGARMVWLVDPERGQVAMPEEQNGADDCAAGPPDRGRCSRR